MQHMADLHDRFRRRLVFSFGAWRAEVLDNFDVRTLMREVTLDGTDAQQAYHQYMGKVGCQLPADCMCPSVCCLDAINSCSAIKRMCAQLFGPAQQRRAVVVLASIFAPVACCTAEPDQPAQDAHWIPRILVVKL